MESANNEIPNQEQQKEIQRYGRKNARGGEQGKQTSPTIAALRQNRGIPHYQNELGHGIPGCLHPPPALRFDVRSKEHDIFDLPFPDRGQAGAADDQFPVDQQIGVLAAQVGFTCGQATLEPNCSAPTLG